jgi:hypothetical protein
MSVWSGFWQAWSGRLPFLKGGEVGQDFRAVYVGLHVHVGFAHNAIGIDEKGVAGRKFYDGHGGVVGFGDLVFGVGEEFEA